MKALLYAEYGPPSVLEMIDVDAPSAGPGEVVLDVKAVSLNPVDFLVRQGLRQGIFAVTFPSRIGSDFAGIVTSVGDGVSTAVGDPVFGSTSFLSLAESIVVPERALARKPDAVSWEAAGSLGVSGMTAYDALASQNVTADDTVLVSAAAGGVGVLLAQLAVRKGATVIGSASPQNHALLRGLGVIPVSYGTGHVDEVRAVAPRGVTVAFDQWGDDAIVAAIELGVPRERINTVATDPTPHGVVRVGRRPTDPATLAELARRVGSGELVVPIDSVYRFDRFLEAFERVEGRHVSGKVVITL